MDDYYSLKMKCNIFFVKNPPLDGVIQSCGLSKGLIFSKGGGILAQEGSFNNELPNLVLNSLKLFTYILK